MIPVVDKDEKHKKKKETSHEHFDSDMVKAVDEEAANMDLVVQDLKSDNGEE